MKVLVTLGTGSIGRHLAEQQLGKKHQVICFSEQSEAQLAGLGAKIVQGSLEEMPKLMSACKDVKAVFHTASVESNGFLKDDSSEDYQRYHRGNVLATQNVINACTQQKVKKLIYTSSSTVVDGKQLQGAGKSTPYAKDFSSPYQKTKVMAEMRVLSANGLEGLQTTAIRPHFVWGPEDDRSLPALIDMAASGHLNIIGEGDSKMSVSYVENVAHAHVLAAHSVDSAGNAYFIAEQQPVIFWKWLNMFLEALDKPQLTTRVSLEDAMYGSRWRRLLHRYLGFKAKPLYSQQLIELMTLDQSFSAETAQQDFNYEPLVSPKEALEKTLDYYRQRDKR